MSAITVSVCYCAGRLERVCRKVYPLDDWRSCEKKGRHFIDITIRTGWHRVNSFCYPAPVVAPHKLRAFWNGFAAGMPEEDIQDCVLPGAFGPVYH